MLAIEILLTRKKFKIYHIESHLSIDYSILFHSWKQQKKATRIHMDMVCIFFLFKWINIDIISIIHLKIITKYRVSFSIRLCFIVKKNASILLIKFNCFHTASSFFNGNIVFFRFDLYSWIAQVVWIDVYVSNDDENEIESFFYCFVLCLSMLSNDIYIS